MTRLSFTFAVWATLVTVSTAGAAEPTKLYDVTESRSRVTNVAHAYYPDKGELRVRLTLANGFEKYAVYRDPTTVNSVLTILRNEPRKLFCVFKDNEIVAIVVE